MMSEPSIEAFRKGMRLGDLVERYKKKRGSLENLSKREQGVLKAQLTRYNIWQTQNKILEGEF